MPTPKMSTITPIILKIFQICVMSFGLVLMKSVLKIHQLFKIPTLLHKNVDPKIETERERERTKEYIFFENMKLQFEKTFSQLNWTRPKGSFHFCTLG